MTVKYFLIFLTLIKTEIHMWPILYGHMSWTVYDSVNPTVNFLADMSVSKLKWGCEFHFPVELNFSLQNSQMI